MAKVGCPTKYKPIYCKRIVEWMRDGKSVEWCAGKMEVSKDTIYQWIKIHEEFSDAVKEGLALSQMWWEDAAQNNLTADKFQSTTWKFNMANRFRWRDHIETITQVRSLKTKEEIEKMSMEELQEEAKKLCAGN